MRAELLSLPEIDHTHWAVSSPQQTLREVAGRQLAGHIPVSGLLHVHSHHSPRRLATAFTALLIAFELDVFPRVGRLNPR